MRVILRSDVANLGKRGDIIDVADGYGRNYLVPKGIALKASDGAQSQAKAMRRSRDLRDAQDRSAAEEVATTLVSKVVTITARAGGEGKLFGSVTASDIASAVESQTGVALDRRKLELDEPVKTLGTHVVSVRLHTDVQFPITVEVVAE